MADNVGHLPRGPGRIFKAAVWSFQGLRAAWLHESSFRLEVYLTVVLAPLAWWLGQTPVERILMIGSCLLVMSAELLNSAVEALIERYGDSSRAMCSQAEAAFQGGDIRQALAHVRNASLFLQRALGAAGVVTPMATGSLQ